MIVAGLCLKVSTDDLTSGHSRYAAPTSQAAKAKDLLAKLSKNITGGAPPNVLGNGASRQPAAAVPVRKMQSLSELNEFE